MLLSDKKSTCNNNNINNSKNKSNSNLAIAIAIPVMVLVVIIAIVSLYFIPKAKMWKQIRSEEKKMERESIKIRGPRATEMNDFMNIERIDKMEVNTVAGNFTVRF